MVLFQCVGWCVGGGVQSRGVRCADPTGCASGRAPEVTQTCSIRKQCEAQWFTGSLPTLYIVISEPDIIPLNVF